jgi:hypothetical protein
MRRGLWLFLTFAAELSGTPGIAAGFALAYDANRNKAAPVIGGNPSSVESSDAGGAAGSGDIVPKSISPKRNISVTENVSAT